MAEDDRVLDESGFRRSIDGKVFACFWEPIGRADLERTPDRRQLPVSYLECSQCTKEKCLICNNYTPSTKVYRI